MLAEMEACGFVSHKNARRGAQMLGTKLPG